MTAERLAWIMSGLDRSKLNLAEKKIIQKIEQKGAENISESQAGILEQIYRSKSR